MASLFSKLVSGELPCHKVAENDKFLAFLDIMPLEPGHTLVIPKVEVDYIFDIEDDLLAEMHVFAKKVAIALKKSVPCLRIGIAVVGLEVPHAHIHLVPLKSISSINFSKEKFKMNDDELKHLAQTISQAFIN
jgi:histidine triad (HIT) family protein